MLHSHSCTSLVKSRVFIQHCPLLADQFNEGQSFYEPTYYNSGTKKIMLIFLRIRKPSAGQWAKAEWPKYMLRIKRVRFYFYIQVPRFLRTWFNSNPSIQCGKYGCFGFTWAFSQASLGKLHSRRIRKKAVIHTSFPVIRRWHFLVFVSKLEGCQVPSQYFSCSLTLPMQ